MIGASSDQCVLRGGNYSQPAFGTGGHTMNRVARAILGAALRITAAATALSILTVLPGGGFNAGARAAEGIIQRGDAAVTGFSGTLAEKNIPADVHPLDRTFINLDGNALQIFDLSVLGTGPRGQVSDALPKLQIKAREFGQVFGVTLDDGGASKTPNVYATSTSMFGLQIVKEGANGKLERLVNGAAGAKWMPGQFGLDKDGTPGSIYKIDGKTGAVSLFAKVRFDDRDNAGPGLGNISFDRKTQQLFVSDLETGLIHRFTLDGKERDVYDHGMIGRKAQKLEPVAYDSSRRMDIASPAFNSEDIATWGFADERRRVFGLAVSAGRLYYSVAEGASVWSVSIDAEGDFGTDARIELEIGKAYPGTNITDIVFDGNGMMYLSQRGVASGSYDYAKFASPQQAFVMRFAWDEKEGRWAAKPQEYAIGLAKEHNATLGGIALNYGYDKNGNINYGACRQTLWSTGEHLREGEDVQRVALGGAKIVHGLQGHYKSRVRPDNEPPYQSWFLDYDNRHQDADAFGHVGDVAIYAPCEGSSAPVELLEDKPHYINPEFPYPADDAGLLLDKRCYAGAIGGKIRCTISVRNVSTAVLTENVVITDATRIMAGPGAGALVPIIASSVSNPGINCTPTPTLNFACTIPVALLLPGDVASFDVWINTFDLALGGNMGFRNCAVLHHAAGWAKACAEGGTDIVVEKIGPGTCLPGLACKFGLSIKNAGLMPYAGDVLLADAMFVGGAVVNAPVTAVNPPIACTVGNINQLPFTCVTPLVLAPGEEHFHWVDVTMPAPGGYVAENCFGVLDPAMLPPGPLPPPLLMGGAGPSGNPACVWVDVPVPAHNLKVTKTATGAGAGLCNKVGDLLSCTYDIAIINQDLAPVNGIIKFDEKVPATTQALHVGPGWNCVGGPANYACNSLAAVNIPAGGTVTIPAVIDIKATDVEALGCNVPNEVKLTLPVAGAAPNLNPADDTAFANAWTFGLWWVDGGGVVHVLCDPTNQKVQKTAKGPCVQDGSDWQCTYAVTVTNTGPDPYKGPLKLAETFGVAPKNVSFSGPFTCIGAGANFTCENAHVETVKDQVLTLEVKATFADDGTCEAPNTAKLTFPNAGTAANRIGTDDAASATAEIPSARCTKDDAPQVCPDGRPTPKSGRCPCPANRIYNADTRQCDNLGDKPGDRPQSEPDPIPPVKQCPRGTTGIWPKCIEIVEDCPRGTILDDGECVRPEPQCEPGPNEVRNSKGRCVCRQDYVRNDNGVCKPVVELCQPGPNEHRNRRGNCVCDGGFERNGNGVCVREENPADDCKEKGWRWTGSRCVPPSNPGDDCKERGWIWTGSKCIPPKDPAQECRDKEWRWTGSRCVPPSNPADDCKKGWEWNGKRCVPPANPADNCNEGWEWNGKRCVPPAPKKCPPGTWGTPPKCKKIKFEVPDIVIKPKNPKYEDGPQRPTKPPRPNSDGPSNNPGVKQKVPGLQFKQFSPKFNLGKSGG